MIGTSKQCETSWERKKAMQYKKLLCYFAGMANFGAARKKKEVFQQAV
jgi:hypothetical protein